MHSYLQPVLTLLKLLAVAAAAAGGAVGAVAVSINASKAATTHTLALFFSVSGQSKTNK